MSKQWTGDDVLQTAWGFQASCVLTAAAELDVFGVLAEGPMTAEALAGRIDADLRGTTILADALAGIGLLVKDGAAYSPAPGAVEALTESGSDSVLAMVRHSANCLRGWSQLAPIVKAGKPIDPRPVSIRGATADHEAFIEAMNDISRRTADSLVASIGPPEFEHLLDIGGGPGTWTIAMLSAVRGTRATLFDLPEVIPIARRHFEQAGMEDRVTLVAGDFAADAPLPEGADLAWVSAIVHMNSRSENRDLFAKVHAALQDGGQILIRDVVMDESHTSPPARALFAVNMLVHTPGGGTFTFDELSEDLQAAGFTDAAMLHQDEFMNSVVRASKS